MNFKMIKNKVKLLLWFFIKPLLILFKMITKHKVIIWRVDRLGHLALNTHLFLIRRKLKSEKIKVLILSPSKRSKIIANKALWSMFIIQLKAERNIKILSSIINQQTEIYYVLPSRIRFKLSSEISW